MKAVFATVTIATLCVASGAFAQERWWGRDDRWEPRTVDGIVDRVHADLNRAYEGWAVDRRDRHNLDHAEKELRDFAVRWHAGRFNKGELEESIESIQHVVERNHMRPENRDALIGDLGQLQAMRQAYDRREIWERR